jgi:Cu+-exporting ATPase
MAVATDFRSSAGFGVTARVEGREVFVGNEQWLLQNNLVVDPQAQARISAARASGASLIVAGWQGRVRAALAIADTVRPDSAHAIAQLRELGLDVVLLTGDHADVASAVAAETGISRVQAGITPEGKVAAVAALQADGHRVAMIGDGVNDAAALAQADLGIAMGTGTEVAIAASDITLVRANLVAAGEAIALSRHTLRIIHGNLFWAFAYNVAAIPLAALGFLNPMLAGAAMAFSSLFVVLNSLRLRRFAR